MAHGVCENHEMLEGWWVSCTDYGGIDYGRGQS
jgi:hypothetical protein